MRTTDGLVFDDIVSILNYAEDGRVRIARDIFWHGYPKDDWDKASAWEDIRKEANAGTIGFRVGAGSEAELFLCNQAGLRKFHTRTHWCYYSMRFAQAPKVKRPPVCPMVIEVDRTVNIDGIKFRRARWQEYEKGQRKQVEGFEMLPGFADKLGITIPCPFDP